MVEAVKVLKTIASLYGYNFSFRDGAVGGCAWDVRWNL
jgi:hypothetical protein